MKNEVVKMQRLGRRGLQRSLPQNTMENPGRIGVDGYVPAHAVAYSGLRTPAVLSLRFVLRNMIGMTQSIMTANAKRNVSSVA
jgi:hypothetical protein